MDFPVHLQSYAIGEENICLFVPDAQAVKKAYEQNKIAFPYWSKVWPAALALSGYIIQQSHLIQDKNVLEVGAGLGLPSITTARFAKKVLCTDAAPEAVRVAAQSAAHQGLQNFSAAVLDWNDLPDDVEADVLLLSDVNYEPAQFAALQERVAVFLQKEKLVLLATPQRLMARDFIAPLLHRASHRQTFAIKEKGNEATLATVMALRKAAEE